jgi:DNA (cytosine-5)-methyltransferase 1
MKFRSIELFAGAGGLALGLENAGFDAVLLNEIDKHACATLRQNRPNWNVIEGDISQIDFSQYHKNVDFISGGFPCQAFSYAGNKQGFDDIRGTLFFEFARAIQEIQPKVFLGENVRGLLSHDDGRTLATIKAVIADLGYTLLASDVLKAINYRVPQKRERLFLIGVRNDLVSEAKFELPKSHEKIMTLHEALKAGELFDCDVPKSKGRFIRRKRKRF